jgi:hypothetical protein
LARGAEEQQPQVGQERFHRVLDGG